LLEVVAQRWEFNGRAHAALMDIAIRVGVLWGRESAGKSVSQVFSLSGESRGCPEKIKKQKKSTYHISIPVGS
jgi:hypothetical protein